MNLFAAARRSLELWVPRLGSSLSTYRLEIANVAWLSADRAFRVFGTFTISIVAARLLGPNGFGDLSFAQTIIAFLILWVALGLQSAVVKQLIAWPETAAETLGSACLLQIVALVTTLLTLLFWEAAPSDSGAGYTTLVIIMSVGLLLRPTEPARYWFESQVRSKYAVVADNIAFLVGSALKIASLCIWRSIEAFAWATAAEQLIVGVSLLVAYRQDPHRPGRWRVRMALVRQLLHDCWPLLFAGIAVALYTRIDQVVLMHYHGPRETGLYAAATRLSELLYVVPTIIATTLFPRLQRLQIEAPGRHLDAMGRIMTVLASVLMLFSLIVVAFASPLVSLIYGPSYANAAVVLAVHIWTSVFVCLGVLGNQWYLSHGLQHKTLLFTILGAATSFAANVLLVPVWGALGAAIASLTAQIVSAFLADALSASTRAIFYAKSRALFFPFDRIWRLIKKVSQ